MVSKCEYNNCSESLESQDEVVFKKYADDGVGVYFGRIFCSMECCRAQPDGGLCQAVSRGQRMGLAEAREKKRSC